MVTRSKDSFTYSYSEDDIAQLSSADVRPRARYRLQWDQVMSLYSVSVCVRLTPRRTVSCSTDPSPQVSVGTVAMVNYNPDVPKERGFWYDAEITRKVDKKRELYCKLILW